MNLLFAKIENWLFSDFLRDDQNLHKQIFIAPLAKSMCLKLLVNFISQGRAHATN